MIRGYDLGTKEVLLFVLERVVPLESTSKSWHWLLSALCLLLGLWKPWVFILTDPISQPYGECLRLGIVSFFSKEMLLISVSGRPQQRAPSRLFPPPPHRT
jgi:hypothetical protein